MGIQVPPDSTGKIVETETNFDGSQRQVITIGSSEQLDALTAEMKALNNLLFQLILFIEERLAIGA